MSNQLNTLALKQHGFFYVELLEGGNLQCVLWWDKDVEQSPELQAQFMKIAYHFANGEYNQMFANVAIDVGKEKKSEIGEYIAEIFKDADPNKVSMKPSDVFSFENPRRAPFGAPG